MSLKRTKEQQELVNYLKQRWRDLLDCDGYVFGKLQEDENEWMKRVNENQVTGAFASKAMHDAHWSVAVPFRYLMLTGICTFLEETAREFAAHEFADYEARVKKIKKGSMFAKYMRVISESQRFDATKVKNDLDVINAAITLRNFIVHAWGKVPAAKLAIANKAASKIEGANIVNGVVYLGNLADAIIAAEDIGNALIDQLLPWKTRKDSK